MLYPVLIKVKTFVCFRYNDIGIFYYAKIPCKYDLLHIQSKNLILICDSITLEGFTDKSENFLEKNTFVATVMATKVDTPRKSNPIQISKFS